MNEAHAYNGQRFLSMSYITIVSIHWCPWFDAQGSVCDDINGKRARERALPRGFGRLRGSGSQSRIPNPVTTPRPTSSGQKRSISRLILKLKRFKKEPIDMKSSMLPSFLLFSLSSFRPARAREDALGVELELPLVGLDGHRHKAWLIRWHVDQSPPDLDRLVPVCVCVCARGRACGWVGWSKVSQPFLSFPPTKKKAGKITCPHSRRRQGVLKKYPKKTRTASRRA